MKRGVKLGYQTEPINIEFECGIILLCRPFSSYVNEKAKILSGVWLNDLVAGEAVIAELNGEVVGLPDADDVGGRLALGRSLFSQALAICAVTDWENVVNPDTGDDIELNDADLRHIMQITDIADEFYEKYRASLDFFKFEGKD